MAIREYVDFSWLQLSVLALSLGIIIRKILPAWKQYQNVISTMKDIQCNPPHWLYGHLKIFRPDQSSFFHCLSFVKKFPRCQTLWLGPFMVYLQGYHPDFMATLLSADVPEDDFAYRFLRTWVGDGLLTSNGGKWKRNRRLLTPAFHFEVLKKYLVCMNESTSELLNIWSEKIESCSFLEVEAFRDVSRMTLDTILRCILSKESGCQRDEKNAYLQAVKCLTDGSIRRIFNPIYFFDFIFYATPFGRKYKRALDTAHKYTGKAIDERRSQLKSKQQDFDFLDILLHAKDHEGKGLSDQEIRDELDTFIFEGHDTVSSGISWALYNLAIYPEFQDKCRQEVNEILDGKAVVDWQNLPRFRYLTMFIKENMRLYPPVFSTGRSSSEPLMFPRGFGDDLLNPSDKLPPGDAKCFSKTFPKHTNFAVAIQMLHHNPHVWDNPFVFDPERFTPENSAKRSPHAYIPFSAGPRNCIGQNVAMNEMKVVLARTLKNFRIYANEDKPKPEIRWDVILRSRNGIHLKLEKIVKES